MKTLGILFFLMLTRDDVTSTNSTRTLTLESAFLPDVLLSCGLNSLRQTNPNPLLDSSPSLLLCPMLAFAALKRVLF